MRTFSLIVLTAAAVALPATAWAGKNASSGAWVSLSASAHERVPNDQVVVLYRLSFEGKDPQRLRANLNAAAVRVKRLLAATSGVTDTTTGLSLQRLQHFDQKTRREVKTGWRLVQSGKAIGDSVKEAPFWISKLSSAGARVSSLHMQLSPAARTSAYAALERRAIAAFRARAAQAARSLQVRSYRVTKLNIEPQSASPQPRPLVRMTAMAQVGGVAHKPALSAGSSLVSLRVDGTIRLPTKRYAALD